MDAPLSPGDAGHPLRIGFVPGVLPDKWVRRRRERRPEGAVTTRVDTAPLAGLAAGEYRELLEEIADGSLDPAAHLGAIIGLEDLPEALVGLGGAPTSAGMTVARIS